MYCDDRTLMPILQSERPYGPAKEQIKELIPYLCICIDLCQIENVNREGNYIVSVTEQQPKVFIGSILLRDTRSVFKLNYID